MKLLIYLAHSSVSLFVTACITSVATGVCSTLLIRSIHQTIQTESLEIGKFVLQFSMLWIAYGVTAIIATYCVSKLTQQIVHQLRIDLSRSILAAEYQKVETRQGRLIPILTEDIKTISYAIDRLPSVTTGLATALGLIVYLFSISVILSAFTILLFIIIYLIVRLTLPYVRKYSEKTREAWNELFELFEGLVLGLKELTLNQDFSRKYIDDVLIPKSKEQNNFKIKENLVSSITSKMTDLFLLLGIAILIISISKTSFVSFDFFGEYITVVLFTIAPLSTVSGFLPSLKKIDVALEQIERAGLTLSEPVVQKKKIKGAISLIELKQVSHTYHHHEKEEDFVLGPLNLKINRNEIVFISGGNGSGKTTLAKILTGLYLPESGHIYFNDQQVSAANRNSYRAKFSALFNNSYLFDQLLHISNDDLHILGSQLLSEFHLSHKVKIENRKFSTRELSQGQRHRLALITSILEDKEIYLFDEWAANQDSLFKKAFYQDVLPLMKKKGKTVIVISHDDQYFEYADTIFKLVEGKIINKP